MGQCLQKLNLSSIRLKSESMQARGSVGSLILPCIRLYSCEWSSCQLSWHCLGWDMCSYWAAASIYISIVSMKHREDSLHYWQQSHTIQCHQLSPHNHVTIKWMGREDTVPYSVVKGDMVDGILSTRCWKQNKVRSVPSCNQTFQQGIVSDHCTGACLCKWYHTNWQVRLIWIEYSMDRLYLNDLKHWTWGNIR